MSAGLAASRKRRPDESVDELRHLIVGTSALKEAKVEADEEEILQSAGERKTEKNDEPQNQPSSIDESGQRKAPAWLGTHKHLQAAIAAIDDRLIFLRICEELDARGIRYEQISTDGNLVGGPVLRLVDISSLVTKHGVDCQDFFQNLSCKIRLNLPDLCSQLECTFTNPPLVSDFERSEEEVEADKQKPHTWVMQISPQRKREQPSQAIAHSIEDRLLTYCQIYIPVRKFADAYYAYYRRFCNIRAFTYHKLVLSYGDNRDLLFVLYWQWHWQAKTGKYTLCFGQAPGTGRDLPSEGEKNSRWNPHMLVSQLLGERFNRDRDLTWLVNYLVNTHRSLGTIHNFVRTQIFSTKTAAQVLGVEAVFPAGLSSFLVPVDEHVLRLSYGSQMAMEFMLLADNQVAIRDCSAVSSSLAGGVSLSDFWRAYQHQASDEEENQAQADTNLLSQAKTNSNTNNTAMDE